MIQSHQHILICSTSIANYDRRMQRIALTLSQKGYSVAWISRASDPLSLNGIRHSKMSLLFKSGFLFYAFFNLRLFFKLLFAKCDVIYSVDLDTVLPCYLVSKMRSKKIIFDAHEYFTEVPELHQRDGVKKVWERIANICLPNIQNNITVGSELGEIFTERYQQKYHIVRNITPSINVEIKQKPESKKMAYLGVVNKGRGVELAIESLVQLTDKSLKIIGDGDLLNEMKDLAKNLSVDDRVEFVGYVLPSQIQNEIQDCYLAVNMLLSVSKSYYYSLANKFFDYIHLGLPSINMEYPEYQSLNKSYKTGILVKTYDLPSFIEAVQKLNDQSVYEECLVGIKAAKKSLNWESEQEILLKFMDTLK